MNSSYKLYRIRHTNDINTNKLPYFYNRRDGLKFLIFAVLNDPLCKDVAVAWAWRGIAISADDDLGCSSYKNSATPH